MADFNFDMNVRSQTKALRDEAKDWAAGAQPRYVGTNVSYSIFLEFGTSKMNPKPFFRPAIAEAKRDLSQFVRDNTNTTLSGIDDAEELVETVALAVERRVKEIITQKGLIDTGTLRASITAVPGSPSALPDETQVNPAASTGVAI